MKILLALFPWTAPLLAQSTEQAEFFEKKIRPILATKCASCHGGAKPMAGVDFSSGAGLNEVVVAGDAAGSRLYRAVGYADAIKMPPQGKLADHEIDDLKAWIEMGAPWPETLPPLCRKRLPNARIAEGRKFWAFQPVKDYAPPKVKNEAWVKSPIDRFILAKLEERESAPRRRRRN